VFHHEIEENSIRISIGAGGYIRYCFCSIGIQHPAEAAAGLTGRTVESVTEEKN
jgi:hypothetical protein